MTAPFLAPSQAFSPLTVFIPAPITAPPIAGDTADAVNDFAIEAPVFPLASVKFFITFLS